MHEECINTEILVQSRDFPDKDASRFPISSFNKSLHLKCKTLEEEDLLLGEGY